jgi:CheY-like chemotaxis protein
MKQILLVEDNEPILENTTELLELHQYAVLTARNGLEGLNLVRQQLPDLILCDIAMPEFNGYLFLEAVRADPGLQKIPFIFLTASAENVDIQKGLALGANGYLVKPFDGDRLLQLIKENLPL